MTERRPGTVEEIARDILESYGLTNSEMIRVSMLIIEAEQEAFERGARAAVERADQIADEVTQKVCGQPATDKLTVMDWTLEIQNRIRSIDVSSLREEKA